MLDADVLVVGGGVIGWSLARAIAHLDRRVAVADSHPGTGASRVAAGMLAPVTEAAYGEEALSALALRSAEAWPAFAASLEAESGLPVGYRRDGTLLVAADAGDAAWLHELLRYHRDLGLASEWLTPSAARGREPLLAPSIRGALFAPGDAQVDNRRLLAALHRSARALGVAELDAAVEEIVVEHDAVVGAVVGGRLRTAHVVIVAAGFASGALAGLPPAERPPVRPVKGQLLRLRTPEHVPELRYTVRGLVQGTSVYVVPRRDGQVVVGATVEDRGTDRSITAGGVYELLRDALRILPVLAELELTETSAGLRPGSFDNAAIVGPTSVEGLLLACGHYRNGILFTPITVEAILETLRSGSLPAWAGALSPARANVGAFG